MISPDVLKLSPLLLGLAVLCGCSQRGMLIGAASIKQLNVPDAIAVGFNHHQHNRYQSPITRGWRDGDDIEQILVQAIELAQYEILLAVQELSAPMIADALIAAKRRDSIDQPALRLIGVCSEPVKPSKKPAPTRT